MARILVTGGQGFVGGWLRPELTNAGHEVVELDPQVDVRDADAVHAAVASSRPDAIAHLAAVSLSARASADQAAAYGTAVAGTANVMEAARTASHTPVVLVTGSSEVYGEPLATELPLTEASALRATSPYGLSKLAQESVALAFAGRFDLRVVVTRSFNHTGPGQGPDFVVPALADRVRALARGLADTVPVGNLDVRRDISDVRDVVRAYRLLVEAALDVGLGEGGTVVNVCSGESVSIRWVAEELCRLANVPLRLSVDPALSRKVDPPEIRGDFRLLAEATGWHPMRTLSETLRDVWADVPKQSGGAV